MKRRKFVAPPIIAHAHANLRRIKTSCGGAIRGATITVSCHNYPTMKIWRWLLICLVASIALSKLARRYSWQDQSAAGVAENEEMLSRAKAAHETRMAIRPATTDSSDDR